MPADCEDCWRHPAGAAGSPAAAKATVAVDWIVPVESADAAMSAAATEDANRRLRALAPTKPDDAGQILHPVLQPRSAAARPGPMRIVHGPAVNDYVGTRMQWRGKAPAGSTAWLLLVESLPAGTEGSPVARQLVRNALVVPLQSGQLASGKRGHGLGIVRLDESRSMRFPEGASPERLQLVGWVQDASGRLLTAASTACEPAQEAAADMAPDVAPEAAQ